MLIVSPNEIANLSISSWLCNVALLILTPPIITSFKIATGVIVPVLPT